MVLHKESLFLCQVFPAIEQMRSCHTYILYIYIFQRHYYDLAFVCFATVVRSE